MAVMKVKKGDEWIEVAGSVSTAGFTESVGVDTTDCDIGPADATGSLTPDGDEVDGVQKYKLDLTLPRPPVVTTSETEPDAATSCDGDFWVDETASLDPGVDPGTVGTLFAWINFNGIDMTTRDKFNISDVQKNGTGNYTIFFDIDPPTANYASAFGVGTLAGLGSTAVSPFAARTGGATTQQYQFVVCYANGTTSARSDQDYISILFFGKQTT